MWQHAFSRSHRHLSPSTTLLTPPGGVAAHAAHGARHAAHHQRLVGHRPPHQLHRRLVDGVRRLVELVLGVAFLAAPCIFRLLWLPSRIGLRAVAPNPSCRLAWCLPTGFQSIVPYFYAVRGTCALSCPPACRAVQWTLNSSPLCLRSLKCPATAVLAAGRRFHPPCKPTRTCHPAAAARRYTSWPCCCTATGATTTRAASSTARTGTSSAASSSEHAEWGLCLWAGLPAQRKVPACCGGLCRACFTALLHVRRAGGGSWAWACALHALPQGPPALLACQHSSPLGWSCPPAGTACSHSSTERPSRPCLCFLCCLPLLSALLLAAAMLPPLRLPVLHRLLFASSLL